MWHCDRDEGTLSVLMCLSIFCGTNFTCFSNLLVDFLLDDFLTFGHDVSPQIWAVTLQLIKRKPTLFFTFFALPGQEESYVFFTYLLHVQKILEHDITVNHYLFFFLIFWIKFNLVIIILSREWFRNHWLLIFKLYV